jgi:hypothetical protein
VNDPVLARFLGAPNDAARERELESLLVEHVQPIITATVARSARRDFHRRPEDDEDVESAVTLRVIRKLRGLARGEGEPVNRLSEYVATLAQNTIHDVLRERYPEMRRLRRRMRYLLEHDERFAIWMSPAGDRVCGKSAWRGRNGVALTITMDSASTTMCDAHNAAESLEAVFTRLAAPVSFDELARLLPKLWGIAGVVTVDAAEIAAPEETSSPLIEYESRRFLESLWSEVRALRVPQRAALLLNLRDIDGSNALSLLMILDIATFDEIASVLEIPPQRLAGLWSGLPLDDLTIASMLGVTRQQVINLRRAARERLGRRLK